ncbi:hypothetical protein ACRAWD_17040 [Caulobacter segnis]
MSELEVLSSAAAAFPPRTVRGRPLPSLLFFTDPARVSNPEAVAERLPRGAEDRVQSLWCGGRRRPGPPPARHRRRPRRVLLLAGAVPGLAEGIGADGLHMPQARIADLPASAGRAWPLADHRRRP